MAKDRVFELIRNEEVVLFVGAGMSIYAGCPSGAKLSEILYKNLTIELQEQIEYTNDLPKLANEIYNLKGGNKNYLFSTLKKEFQKPYTSTETHQLLAKIPHFKNIITTNYDTLIESTNTNIEVIRKSTDYPIADSKKQLLFKIHSDLSDTEKIILTTTDYNNYFSKSNEHTVFWNAVKDRLASNHILFIGYSFEDSNIFVLLEKIMNELGDNKKEIFFVSPSIPMPKLKYLQKNGIEYIETNGETLINEIYEDLKLNYFPNLTKGIGTADTALNFADSNQIKIELSKNNEGYEINNFKSSDEDKDYKIEVKFDIANEQKDQILGSLNGKNFEDVNLENEMISEFGYFIKGIRLKNENNIHKLILKKAPVFDFNINIVFDDGFEIENYNFKLFGINPNEDEHHLKIIVEDFALLIKIIFNTNEDRTQYSIEVLPDEEIKSTNSGLKFYQILNKIVSNQNFKIYKDNEIFYKYVPITKFEENTFGSKFFLEYFQNLKKIENHFDVRFTKINPEKAYDQSIQYSIKKIIAYIDKTPLIEQFNGHIFKIENENEFEKFVKSAEEERILIISEDTKTIIDLYEIQFDLGYLHRYIGDIIIANLEDLKSNKTSEIALKSKSNLIHSYYSENERVIFKQLNSQKK